MVTSAFAASDNVYHLPHLLASSSPSSSLLNSISSTSSFRNNNHDRSGSSGLNNQRAKCETTLNTCSREMRCAMALQDYRTSCSHLLNNKTRTCTESCRLALISLNSLPEGYDYLNCDCGDNDFCRKVRRRTSVCHLRFNNHLTSPSAPSSSSTSGSTLHGINFPLDSIPPASPSTHSNRGQGTLGSPFSSPSASSLDSHHRYKGKQSHHGSIVLCSTAEARCKEDETCSEAWEFFQVHCEKVFTGTECTKSCNNSLNILYRQRAAHHLDSCILESLPSQTHFTIQ
uniref:GDNF/GAS1 domain-containing protein n=1 Tax=Tetranychus urticae TaxID=32264 RepID=T1JZ07_TETUR